MKLNIPDPNAKHSIEIIEGDNMKTMAGFKDKSIDLAIVDPPYGIGIDKAMNSNKGKQGFKQYKDTDWDNVAPDQEYFNELFRISKNQIIWGGNYFIDKIKTPTQCWLVWNKVQRDFTMSDGELAWTSFDKTIRMFDLSRGGAMGCNNRNGGKLHPCQKPVQLYAWILKNYGQPGDVIFDSHMGSGSLAIACHNLEFDFIGCEMDPDYFAQAKDRIQRHLNQLRLF